MQALRLFYRIYTSLVNKYYNCKIPMSENVDK